jgi:hypothetical protein
MKLLFSFTALVLIAISQTGCDGERVKGSGQMSSETRQLGEYHSISLRGDMDVEFTSGPQEDAVIEAEDNILPYIETEIKGSQLIVRMKPGTHISTHRDIKVKLTAPDIEELSLSGSGNILGTNEWEHNSAVRLSLSGSGNITLGGVNAPGVKVSIAGSGDIRAKGETRDLDIAIAGSGNFDGYNLHTENAAVNIAGSGDANVHASVNLDVKVGGSGDVSYRGTPQITSHIAGSGSVRKQD